MKLTKRSLSRLSIVAVTFGMLLALGIPMWGQEAPEAITVGNVKITGLPDDWTHHHLVFSNPGTEEDAIQNATYVEWLKIVNNPRYIIQQLKRRSPAQGPAAEDVARIEEMARAQEATGGGELPERQGHKPIRPVGPGPVKPPKATIHRDWSMDLGSSGTVGAGQYPAKFSWSTTGTASCSDYVVYNTGLAGGASQATVVAYNNIYASTCSGTVPSVYWQYNTAYPQGSTTGDSSTVTTSVTYSWDGSQVAFVESNSSNVASLVLLKWKSSTSLVQMDTSSNNVVAGSYRSCSAPCMTRITFSGSPNDTNSAPFYDYIADDAIYVGDDSGKLHKFTGVFLGTPAEAGSPWPVTVSSNVLTSPVYDSGTSGNVFVADSGGYLYSYSTSGTAVMKSSRLAATGSGGIGDGPLVDSNTEYVYVFVGDDASTTTSDRCTYTGGCNGVFRFAADNSTVYSGTSVCDSTPGWPSGTNCGQEEVFGAGGGGHIIYDGAFDYIYYSGSGATGYLWTCSAASGFTPRLSDTSMSDFSGVSGAGTSATAIATLSSAAANCSPVTEIYGTAGSKDDYIFLSVSANGNKTGCNGACVYNFVVSTNGTSTSVPSNATNGLAAAGGASGIIIDNTSNTTGASQIYFSSLSNQSCATSGGTGGCAVQASQSAP